MKKIIKWFKNAAIGKDKAFSTDFDEVIGYGLKRGENVLTPKNKAMVLLKKTKDGIKIVTSHPID